MTPRSLLIAFYTLVVLHHSSAQVTTEVSSFDSSSGSSKQRQATMSENAVVERTVRVDSVVPNVGTYTGGTHVHINGDNFAIDTYGGSNSVYFGYSKYDYLAPFGASPWVKCDVIEGACTVDCGGVRKIVCDTRPFEMNDFNTTEFRALKNAEESFFQKYRPPLPGSWAAMRYPEVMLDDRYYKYDIGTKGSICNCDENTAGCLTDGFKYACPRPIWAKTRSDCISGTNLGMHLKDYRTIYFGPGRPPQGGNLESESNSALCRADVLNAAASEDGELLGSEFHPVTVDDINPAPIEKDVVVCKLGDFEAGSYNVSAFMGTTYRSGEGSEIGGLTALFPHYETDLLSMSAKGVPYSAQYFPHISSVEPKVGSKSGGTILTISGGGFSMNPEKNSVQVGGQEVSVQFHQHTHTHTQF
ncbi:hypothetical protein TL16_g00968 [Triparma laevis f. inornata]|uniref:IPT/TIG domain-containing protein n=1 Tax=Triparma laevis f. inornata TaxID=1714386 RepID=A0A9W6ZH81_9STRA|nr:hypothetical protein TL16_g00968 [Triparma laevis f. inornata]